MKRWSLRLMALCMLAAACGSFYGWPTAKALVFQPAPTVAFLVVLLLTPLVGRFFCAWLCPLGIAQSVVNVLTHPKTHVRRVCTRLPQSRAQIVVRSCVFALFVALLACGFGALAWSLTPYSILGKALIGFAPGLVLVGVVLVLAPFGRGRLWCNWVCPVGSCFTVLSRFAVWPHRVDKAAGCLNCRACFGKAAAGKTTESKPADDGAGVTRREMMSGIGLFAAAEAAKVVEKTADGGYAPVSLPGLPNRVRDVLPPGAVDRALFDRLCVGCGLCITACPEKCLVPSTALGTFGQPKMDFRYSHCRMACPQKCASVCPAHALVVREGVARRDLHFGRAAWQKDLCLRTTEQVPCTACVRKCPVKAIALVEGVPVVDEALCIGCGACEHVCPVRPQPAMVVSGLAEQRCVTPMGEADLLAEMTGLVTRGEAAVVAARNGVIVARETGRGVKPLLRILDAGRLPGTVLVDKVVGRAAAAICLVGGVRRVHALLMGEDAAALLRANGVSVTAEKTVPRILNRDQSAPCPLEKTVEGLTEPAKMVKALRAFFCGANASDRVY